MAKKKEGKKDKAALVKSMRSHKKDLQKYRFNLLAEARTKTHQRKALRKSVARIATALRMDSLPKEKK